MKTISILLMFPSGYRERHIRDIRPDQTFAILERPSTAPQNSMMDAHIEFYDQATGRPACWGFTIISETTLDFYPPLEVHKVPKRKKLAKWFKKWFKAKRAELRP